MDPAPDSGLLQYSQDTVVVVDATGEIHYANAATERILGYDPSELVGTDAFELVHPDEAAATRECFERVVGESDPTSESHRYRVRTADGGYVWLESRFSNVTDEGIGGYVVSSRDVTQRVEAEREREAAEGRLSEIAGTVGDVLWMFSADWTELRFVNPAYEEVFGTPVEALREDPSTFLDAIHPEDRDRVREAMARLTAGESVDLEYRVDSDRNYDRWVWVQGEPVVEDDEVVRVVGFAQDVTDRRRRERQLVVMDNLLRHNLRNDMSIIVGNAEEIASEGDDVSAERAEIIRTQGEDLIASAQKQREIIELLTTPTRPQPVDLHETVCAAVDTVRERHSDARIDVDVPESVRAEVLYELQLAIAELLENAIVHDPDDDPCVTVRARETGPNVEIVVEDECPPIPEIEYRVLTGDWVMDDVYHTSGLGLWLVYWVVDLSDGEITFTDHEPGGNAILLRLPRATGDARE